MFLAELLPWICEILYLNTALMAFHVAQFSDELQIDVKIIKNIPEQSLSETFS